MGLMGELEGLVQLEGVGTFQQVLGGLPSTLFKARPRVPDAGCPI